MRVGITETLLHEVDRQIGFMKSKEMSQLKPVIEIMDDETGEWFLKLWWGEHYHLKQVLPDVWKKTAGDSYVAIVNVPVEGTQAARFVVHYELLGDWEQSMPPTYNNYDSAKTIDYEDMPDEFRTGLELAKQYKAADKRWQRVAQQVDKFLRECPSLNKALELWPEFRVYVPQEYLDKVAAQVPKRAKRDLTKATSALADLDKGTLMAAKLRERLADAVAGVDAG